MAAHRLHPALMLINSFARKRGLIDAQVAYWHNAEVAEGPTSVIHVISNKRKRLPLVPRIPDIELSPNLGDGRGQAAAA